MKERNKERNTDRNKETLPAAAVTEAKESEPEIE